MKRTILYGCEPTVKKRINEEAARFFTFGKRGGGLHTKGLLIDALLFRPEGFEALQSFRQRLLDSPKDFDLALHIRCLQTEQSNSGLPASRRVVDTLGAIMSEVSIANAAMRKSLKEVRLKINSSSARAFHAFTRDSQSMQLVFSRPLVAADIQEGLAKTYLVRHAGEQYSFVGREIAPHTLEFKIENNAVGEGLPAGSKITMSASEDGWTALVDRGAEHSHLFGACPTDVLRHAVSLAKIKNYHLA